MNKRQIPSSAKAVLAACLILLMLGYGCSKPKQQEPAANGPSTASQPAPAPGPGVGASKVEAGPCARLLTAKCNACHSTERICERLGKNSKYRWQSTVELMISRGAKINADEASTLVDCLDKNAPELQAACP